MNGTLFMAAIEVIAIARLYFTCGVYIFFGQHINTNKTERTLKSVHFVWADRQPENMNWFFDELIRIKEADSSHLFSIQVFLTRAKKKIDVEQLYSKNQPKYTPPKKLLDDDDEDGNRKDTQDSDWAPKKNKNGGTWAQADTTKGGEGESTTKGKGGVKFNEPKKENKPDSVYMSDGSIEITAGRPNFANVFRGLLQTRYQNVKEGHTVGVAYCGNVGLGRMVAEGARTALAELSLGGRERTHFKYFKENF